MNQSELLEKIARNTEPKASFYILISENSTRIRTRFNPLIQLDKTKKYEMALAWKLTTPFQI